MRQALVFGVLFLALNANGQGIYASVDLGYAFFDGDDIKSALKVIDREVRPYSQSTPRFNDFSSGLVFGGELGYAFSNGLQIGIRAEHLHENAEQVFGFWYPPEESVAVEASALPVYAMVTYRFGSSSFRPYISGGVGALVSTSNLIVSSEQQPYDEDPGGGLTVLVALGAEYMLSHDFGIAGEIGYRRVKFILGQPYTWPAWYLEEAVIREIDFSGFHFSSRFTVRFAGS
jgi:hypothetical protein